MPAKTKQSFENDAHAPTNEARHNIVNLIKNDREAMKNTNVAKKKATTKFKSDGTHHSGKMVGAAGAPMGLKGLRKAKKSKNKAKQKMVNEQAVEGKEGAKTDALNQVRNNDSTGSMMQHANEPPSSFPHLTACSLSSPLLPPRRRALKR
jgi:hypothetical protein